MNAKQKIAMYEAIEEHGKKLLALFPNAKEKDPIRLCKRLRVYEGKVRHGINLACQPYWYEMGENYIQQGLRGAKRLLGTDDIDYDDNSDTHLIVNISEHEWMYVAPDLSPTGEYTNGITGYAVKRGTQ